MKSFPSSHAQAEFGMRVLTAIGKHWSMYFLLLSMLMVGTYSALTYQHAQSLQVATTTRTPIVKGASTEKPAAAAAAAPVVATPAPASKPTAPATPICSRAAVSPAPSSLPISLSQPGLTQVVDAPQYYQIYGHTATEVYRQLNACMPLLGGGEIIAGTNRVINWKFTHAMNGGLCKITTVAVGVHISQQYPQWNSSPYAAPTFVSKWQNFMAHVIEHENHHRDLDIQYANKILHDLQNLPAMDCDSIIQTAKNTANANIAVLDQANTSFDAHTDHGSILGIIRP